MFRHRSLALLTLGATLVACGGGSDSPVAPSTSVSGTYIGDYTNSADPGVVYQGVLQLTQTGGRVTGTLTTNAGRTAAIAGAVDGQRLTVTFTYTDGCSGTASSAADVVQGGTRITGNYSSTDCLGRTAGGYVLVKQ